jgi:hypothetical protein
MSSTLCAPASVLNTPPATVVVVNHQVGKNRAVRRRTHAEAGAPLLTIPTAARQPTTNVPPSLPGTGTCCDHRALEHRAARRNAHD